MPENIFVFDFTRWDTVPAPVVLGHMVVPPNATDQWLMVDLRRWVSDPAEPPIKTIMVVRPYRFDANALQPGDRLAFSNAEFDSREASPALQPRLTVQFVVAANDAGGDMSQAGGASAEPAIVSDDAIQSGVTPANAAAASAAAEEELDEATLEALGSESSSYAAHSHDQSSGGLGRRTDAGVRQNSTAASGQQLQQASSSGVEEAAGVAELASRHWYRFWEWTLSSNVVLITLALAVVVYIALRRRFRRNGSSRGNSKQCAFVRVVRTS